MIFGTFWGSLGAWGFLLFVWFAAFADFGCFLLFLAVCLSFAEFCIVEASEALWCWDLLSFAGLWC